jgi:hypothetical protein
MGRVVAGLAVLGLLVGTGCGDDDDGGASRAEIEEFCDGFNEVNDAFANANPVANPEALREALRMLRELEPPDEIADQYATVLEGFEKLSKIEITDPNAVAQVQKDLPNAEEAFDAVAQFVDEKC